METETPPLPIIHITVILCRVEEHCAANMFAKPVVQSCMFLLRYVQQITIANDINMLDGKCVAKDRFQRILTLCLCLWYL